MKKFCQNCNLHLFDCRFSLNLPLIKSLKLYFFCIKGETFIEIGVNRGDFADKIIKQWPSLKRYHGIDVWKHQENYKDGANIADLEQEKVYIQALDVLKKHGNKIQLIRNYSNIVVNMFQDKSIDFIYVDARHDFCGVYEDLSLYFQKLKCNGIMTGYDYHTVEEVIKNSPNDDWGVCANGSRILINGGAVKG